MIGVVLGALTWGTLGVIGVSAILALNPSALIIIKLFGGGYLMFLSLSSLKKLCIFMIYMAASLKAYFSLFLRLQA